MAGPRGELEECEGGARGPGLPQLADALWQIPLPHTQPGISLPLSGLQGQR